MLLNGANPLTAQGLADDLYERFLSYADVAPSSANTYRRSLRQLREYLNARSIAAPRREDLLAFKRFLLDTKKPSTAQSYLSAARVFFAWLESEGLYPNVVSGIKNVKLTRGFNRDYFTPDMIRMILDGIDRETLQGKRDYALISLMVSCGLRTCEAAAARVYDLRPRADKTVLYVLSKGKTERSDFVIVPPVVQRAVRAYLAERGSLDDSAPLFASTSNLNRNDGMTPRSISGICKEHFRKAGFDSDRLSAHSLRHTAVTVAMMSENANLHEVQLFARHRSPTTTAIYAHELENRDNRCSVDIADAIF